MQGGGRWEASGEQQGWGSGVAVPPETKYESPFIQARLSQCHAGAWLSRPVQGHPPVPVFPPAASPLACVSSGPFLYFTAYSALGILESSRILARTRLPLLALQAEGDHGPSPCPIPCTHPDPSSPPGPGWVARDRDEGSLLPPPYSAARAWAVPSPRRGMARRPGQCQLYPSPGQGIPFASDACTGHFHHEPIAENSFLDVFASLLVESWRTNCVAMCHVRALLARSTSCAYCIFFP